MKTNVILLCLVSIFLERAFAALEIKISQSESEVQIKLENSGDDVYLQYLSNEWIGVQFQLWDLGRGVSLYPPNDAKWRRESGFVNLRWKVLGKGESATLSFDFSTALPESPQNDDFAKRLYGNINKGETFTVIVVVEYSNQSDGIGEILELYKKINLEK